MRPLSPAAAASMIEAACLRLTEHQQELSRLDSVAGDGDHGVNMVAAFADAQRRIESTGPTTVGDVFGITSRAFLETVGGASGALLGAFFAAAARSLGALQSASPADVVAALEAGRDRLVRVGKTELGQKTMLDALDPALRAARAEVDSGLDLAAVMAAAHAAAVEGAAATAEMRPTVGRAKYAADESMGTPDPGATTVAHLFGAWTDSLRSEVAT